MAQVVDHLLSKHEALSSNTAKKKRRKEKYSLEKEGQRI
jgi:hypothetical protein